MHQFGTETPVWNPDIELYPCRDDDIGMQGIRSAPGIDCINGCAAAQSPWCYCAREVWDAGRGTGQLWAALTRAPCCRHCREKLETQLLFRLLQRVYSRCSSLALRGLSGCRQHFYHLPQALTMGQMLG